MALSPSDGDVWRSVRHTAAVGAVTRRRAETVIQDLEDRNALDVHVKVCSPDDPCENCADTNRSITPAP